jgi:Mg-chelatase subunit ChlD
LSYTKCLGKNTEVISMRIITIAVLTVLVYGCATSSDTGSEQFTADTAGGLKVEIHSPSPDLLLRNGQKWIEVEGGASTFGGARYVDLILVLDNSKSLARSDPDNYRSAGAAGLVRSLSPRSDIRIGVVGSDTDGSLASPLTSDRGAVVETLADTGYAGSTDVGAGIRMALAEFADNAQQDSSRVIMLFMDGKSNAKKARRAAEEAEAQGVAIHTLLLGSSKKSALILQEIALATGASFNQVMEPAQLPDAFLNLRTTGVDNVTLQVNDASPIPTRLAGGTFSGRAALRPGENRIVAVATGLNGQTAQSVVNVNAGPANCAALEVMAVSNGRPTMSINDRAVEIVVDASRSMWGRMDGQAKMTVAKDILQEVSNWYPGELKLALRAYGHKSASEQNDCADSQLLVAFGKDNREMIRQAMAGLSPLGQTPLAYALNQVAGDFGRSRGEQAVVLVTDGIESCGGDPVAAARMLRKQDIVIHVIGFGMENAEDEDTDGLNAVAQASGGRFLTAGSAEELKEALAGTVGTPIQVFKGDTVVANSALGSGEPMVLPEGDYRVQVNGSPPQEVQVSLVPGERVTMILEKAAGSVSHSERRRLVGYTPCQEPELALQQAR